VLTPFGVPLHPFEAGVDRVGGALEDVEHGKLEAEGRWFDSSRTHQEYKASVICSGDALDQTGQGWINSGMRVHADSRDKKL